MASHEADEIIKAVDLNGNGEIDFSEWIIATNARSTLLEESKLKFAFDFFDKNKSGFIDKEQLCAAMKEKEIAEEEWKLIID